MRSDKKIIKHITEVNKNCETSIQEGIVVVLEMSVSSNQCGIQSVIFPLSLSERPKTMIIYVFRIFMMENVVPGLNL